MKIKKNKISFILSDVLRLFVQIFFHQSSKFEFAYFLKILELFRFTFFLYLNWFLFIYLNF